VADLARTFAALQTLFADNTSGDISAQDLRDFLASAYSPQGTCGHRLTTDSNVSVTMTDRTAQATVYLTPHEHNRLGLYDGTSWLELAVPEIAVKLSGLTSGKNYDLFAFWSTPTHASTDTGTDVVTWSANPGWNSGTYVRVDSTGSGLTAGTTYYYNRAGATSGSFHTTLADALAGTSKVDLSGNVTQTLVGVTLELGPTWDAGAGAGSDTARGTGAGSTALTVQDGAYVNGVSVTGTIGGGTIAAKAGLYAGTLRTTGTTTTEDSADARFLWNMYNQHIRKLYITESGDGWTYGTDTFRQVNANSANKVEMVCGLAGRGNVSLHAYDQGSSGNGVPGIGINSTTVQSADVYQNATLSMLAMLCDPMRLGYNYYAWLEKALASTTFYSTDGAGARRGGMVGWCEG
jgi:hypothetical protein